MKKVRMIVEMDEDLYKAFTEQRVIISGMRTGKTLLSEIWKAVKNATPLTECDDCISRQEAKIALVQYMRGEKSLCECIDDCSSVLPKREQGEWIFEEVGVRTQVLKCSKCGTIIQRGENFTQEEFKKYINDILREKCITLDNFCHNCGAKMAERGEE